MKKTIQELGDTSASDVRGSAISNGYVLEPKKWLSEIIDAAKKRHIFMQAAYVTKAEKGVKDVIIPYRKNYIGNTGTFADQTSAGSSVTFTSIDNLDGLQLTPSPHSYGVAIPRYLLNTNAVDLINVAKDELVYYAGDVVDQAIAEGLRQAGTATSSASGAQELFGGDATSLATLESGDILTTDLIADARTRLMSTTCKYWSGGSQGDSSASKNGWMPDDKEPFMLFLSAEQDNGMIKDGQFVNAAEYGTNEIVMNGEIGKYLGVKYIITPNTPASGDGGFCESDDWGAGDGVKGHMCLMVKAKKACAFAWGDEPDLQVFDYPREQETDLVLYMEYDTDSFYDDAIVKIYVSDS